MEEFTIESCPQCKLTNISLDMFKKISCRRCGYTGDPKLITGEILLKPWMELEEKEREILKPMVYFQKKDLEEKERDQSLRSL